LDEWGADPQDKDMSRPARAAFAASSLIYMLGGPIDSQTYVRADAALRDAGGESELTAQVLKTFGALKSTPQLVRTSGGDDSGFALIAARSLDKRMVQIVISNYEVPAKALGPRGNWDTSLPERRSLQYRDNGGYDATVSVATDGKYQVKRYRISDSANLSLVDQSVQSGPNLRLQAVLPPPSVEFIVITAK
jgi:xylan 1,4-beta-xylosidase